MKRSGAAVRVVLSAEQLSVLDDWIESRPDPKPSRPEAIRRLITCALVDHPGQ
jgi:hypothetical protein